jgi:hypothetical protein
MVPDTVETKPENFLGATLVTLAHLLDYKVVLLPYENRQIRDLSENDIKFTAGISFITEDFERHLNVRRKEDMYETGRTFARAQQILGLFNSEGCFTADALKRDHRWFGNNPDEYEGEKRTRVPVLYMGRDIERYWLEREWAKPLTTLLLSLLKKSHTLLTEEVRNLAIRDNCLSYSEAVENFGKVDVVVTPATGRKPAVKSRRVPRKPKQNSLLLKGEIEIIDEIISPMFKAIEIHSKDEWIDAIKEHGWPKVKRRLRENASDRAEFLQRFSSMTTKRLNEVRRTVAPAKTKRKRDISSDELISTLSQRGNPVMIFVTEVLALDPSFTKANKVFAIKEKNTDTVDIAAARSALDKFVGERALQEYISNKVNLSGPILEEEKTEEYQGSGKPATTQVAAAQAFLGDPSEPKWARDGLRFILSNKNIRMLLDTQKNLITALRAEANKSANKNLNNEESKTLWNEIYVKVSGQSGSKRSG